MKRYIRSSQSSAKVTGKNYDDFIHNIEMETIYLVDSAYLRRRKGENWIVLLGPDGTQYDAEITQYTDGSYELMLYNISRAR